MFQRADMSFSVVVVFVLVPPQRRESNFQEAAVRFLLSSSTPSLGSLETKPFFPRSFVLLVFSLARRDSLGMTVSAVEDDSVLLCVGGG